MAKRDKLYLDVVNAQEAIFSGDVKSLQVTGTVGELGIFPGHTPLLTAIEPGFVSFRTLDGELQVVYLSGGIIEVQPSHVNILADVAIRGADLDHEAAVEAKRQAELSLSQSTSEHANQSMDYSAATIQLTNAIAQLRVMAMIRKLKAGSRH